MCHWKTCSGAISGIKKPPSLSRNRATTLRQPGLVIALLTPAVLLVHGFHPLADDGAVYVAGIKKLADPALYPRDAVFVLAPTHLSVFAHVLALPLHSGLIPLSWMLLVCHLASIVLFLLGIWRVAAAVFPDPAARWGAVVLAACCFTLPVAGTSLSLMDPYLTARSFSTPLGLFALAGVLGEERWQPLLWLLLAALVHPLMAGYAAIACLMAWAARHKAASAPMLLAAAGWGLCAAIFVATRHADPALPYNRAALSRSYFFLARWRGYEFPGLLLPLLLLGGCARSRLSPPARALALAATLTGACALLASLCFVHDSGSLLLARLQVLRAFQFVYLAGVLLAGGALGNFAPRHPRKVALLMVLPAAALFAGQRLTYPASNHVEWPGVAPRNPWQQAFLWIRTHTAKDAVFALDNDYIESPGDDAQGFRATAERSALADWFKDGGIAGNFREASAQWWQGAQATARLNRASDAERLARVLPLGATWIVLPASAETGLVCPYQNEAVRVCRLTR